MILEPDMFVPSLGWRMGEYQALTALSASAKSRIVPLITIPPIEFDFDSRAPKKSPHEHLFPFPSRLESKWGMLPCWIDIDPSLRSKTMNDGTSSYQYIFGSVRAFSAHSMPIVSMEMDENILDELRIIIGIDQRGAGIRVRLEDIMALTFSETVAAILQLLDVSFSETDLIVDLEAPNYKPYESFASALVSALKVISNLSSYRNLVIVGTAIPDSLANVGKKGASLTRHDWLFYKELINTLPDSMRRPVYGDYTIVHPSFVARDMRLLKPAGKVVYAKDGAWAVYKGGAFQDDPEQMHEHCKSIVKSSDFKGCSYSYGDNYIADCAKMKKGASNLSQWKKIAINHHIMVVLEDLSNLNDES